MFLFSARPDRDAEFPGHSMPKKENLRYFPFGGWSVVSMRLDLALFQKWCKAGTGKWRLSGMSLHRARR